MNLCNWTGLVLMWLVLSVATAFAQSPDYWVQQLESAKEAERYQAQSHLVRLGAKSIPLLTTAMQHRDPEVRLRAAAALGRIGPVAEPAVPALVKALKDSSLEVQAQAAGALGQIPASGKVAIPVLTETVAQSIKLGMAAKRSTGESGELFGPPSTRDKEIFLILRSIESLGNFGPDSRIATPLLLQAVSQKDLDPFVRVSSAKNLARIGADVTDAVPVLLKALSREEPDKEVRAGAAEALGLFPKPGETAILALMETATDVELEVRTTSVDALGHIGSEAKPAVPLLLKTLSDDSSPSIRQQAVFAVHRVGRGDAEVVLPALIAALEKDSEVRVAVASVLGFWGEQATPAIPNLIKAMKSRQRYLDREAAQSLGKIGVNAKAAVPDLMKQFTSRVSSNRPEAAFALWQIDGHQPGRQFLLDTLKNSKADWSERSRTCQLLRIMSPPPKEAVPLLVAALHDPQIFVRENAAKALKAIDPEAAEKANVNLTK